MKSHELREIMRILDTILQNIPLRFNHVDLDDK